MAASMQFLSTPAKLPKEWQPKLHEWKIYHSSHPDVRQAGWRKWGREHPDWYAKRSTSTHTDWYNRERDTIRRSDYKCINWHYERPSKPTSRVHDDFIPRENDVMMKDVQRSMPHNKHYLGQFSYPKPYPMEVPPPKWGLYNPPNYEEPTRFNHFPPIKYNGY